MSTGRLTITVDGRRCDVPSDVSVAAALLAVGGDVSVFCGMGSCHSCVLTVDGVRGVRACITPVRAEMTVETRGFA